MSGPPTVMDTGCLTGRRPPSAPATPAPGNARRDRASRGPSPAARRPTRSRPRHAARRGRGRRAAGAARGRARRRHGRRRRRRSRPAVRPPRGSCRCGTHEHGLAAKRRLQHVMAAVRDETAADEDRVGDGVHLGQLATVSTTMMSGSRRAWPRVRPGVAASGARQCAAAHRGEAARRDEGQHLVHPLRMPGRQDQREPRRLDRRRRLRGEHGLFLAAVRAAGDPDALIAREAEQPPPQVGGADRVRRRVVLEIARHRDALRRGPQRDDPPRVLVRAHGEDAHVGQHTAQRRANQPVARKERSESRPLAIIVGTPRAASARSVLGQSSVSMQMKKADRWPPGCGVPRRKVEREVAWRAMPAKRSATTRAPRRRHRADYQRAARIGLVKALHEGRRRDRLADGHRVHPAARPRPGLAAEGRSAPADSAARRA